MKRQDIYVRNMEEGLDIEFPTFGVELRPPVGGDLVAAGLCKALKMRYSNRERHIIQYDAEEAEVTRNDEEGTALMIRPNDNLASDALSSALVAYWIASRIDPADQLQKVYYIDDDRQGTTDLLI